MAKFVKTYNENLQLVGMQEVNQGGGGSTTEIVKVEVGFDDGSRYPTITSSELAKLEAATGNQVMVYEYKGYSSFMSISIGFIARKSDGFYIQQGGSAQKLYVVD